MRARSGGSHSLGAAPIGVPSATPVYVGSFHGRATPTLSRWRGSNIGGMGGGGGGGGWRVSIVAVASHGRFDLCPDPFGPPGSACSIVRAIVRRCAQGRSGIELGSGRSDHAGEGAGGVQIRIESLGEVETRRDGGIRAVARGRASRRVRISRGKQVRWWPMSCPFGRRRNLETGRARRWLQGRLSTELR